MRARTPTRGRLQAVALLLGAAGLGGACDGSEDSACMTAARPVAAGAREAAGTAAALAGTWSGSARVGVAWCRQTLIPVSLVIAADGRVTGRVGDATLVGARLVSHRGPLLRRLGLSSDWLVGADLAGPLVAAEGIVRSVLRMPFDVVGGRLHGTLVTDGTVFGGREALSFSAAFDDLSRAVA